MNIDGLILSGYRSFGETPQRIGPFGRVNLFIGRNNSGKSNVLRFLHHHYNSLLKPVFQLPSEERHLDVHQATDVGLGIRASDTYLLELVQQSFRKSSEAGRKAFVNRLMDSHLYEHETLWLQRTPGKKPHPDRALIDPIYRAIENDCVDLGGNLLGSRRHPHDARDIYPREIAQSLWSTIVKRLASPDTRFVPAFRRVMRGEGTTETEQFDCGGSNLIDHLQRLQAPDHTQQNDKQRFAQINDFVRAVTGKTEASLEIPHHKQTIQISMDGKTLPLESLGTGLHEVIILATVGTIHENTVICLEEPEIHLHPILQKMLLRYLIENTSNQYFIATHSAHLLDTPEATVLHVTHDGHQSTVTTAVHADGRDSICRDLGYMASDLLQANLIIWVEGPSDRIYVRWWLNTAAPDLKEGVHYSIMFYGGRLLSHLKSTDKEVVDFINLRNLNRYMAVIMDSDKDNNDKTINATKTRIKGELSDKDRPQMAWVTKGREIENYIPDRIFVEAVREEHNKKAHLEGLGEYGRKVRYTVNGGKPKEIDKVKVARRVSKGNADFSVLDLNDRIEELVCLIHVANGQDVATRETEDDQ